MDAVRRALSETRPTGRGEEIASAQSAKSGKTETLVFSFELNVRELTFQTDLKTISRFAQLEYKFGDPERGKTIFEGVVDSHSKRWDLWSIYVDMEAAQGDIASVR